MNAASLRITFQGASAGDADRLADLRVEAMRESLERIGRFHPERARERLLTGFSPQHTNCILLGNEIVGLFVVKPHERGLNLEHLYVLPRHQRRGIGEAVLAHVFAVADASRLQVQTGALRGSGSNRFYVRHGFVQVEQGELDNYYVRACKD